MSDQIVNIDNLPQLTELDPEDFLMGIDDSQIDPELATIIIKAKNSIFNIKVTYDLSSGPVIHALPTAVGFNVEIIITIRNASISSNELSFTTISSQLINGNSAASWGLRNDSTITLYSDGSNWQVKTMSEMLFHVQDQKTVGSDGGTFTSGSWQTRVLDPVITNTIAGASLSSNQITLPAGTYDISASAPAYFVNTHKAKIRNISDAADEIIGTNEYCDSTGGGQNVTKSWVIGRITLASTKVLELQHTCLATRATNGFGLNNNFGVIEVYSDIQIRKIA